MFSYEVENFLCVRVEAQLFLWYDFDKADGLMEDLSYLLTFILKKGERGQKCSSF